MWLMQSRWALVIIILICFAIYGLAGWYDGKYGEEDKVEGNSGDDKG